MYFHWYLKHSWGPCGVMSARTGGKHSTKPCLPFQRILSQEKTVPLTCHTRKRSLTKHIRPPSSVQSRENLGLAFSSFYNWNSELSILISRESLFPLWCELWRAGTITDSNEIWYSMTWVQMVQSASSPSDGLVRLSIRLDPWSTDLYTWRLLWLRSSVSSVGLWW